MTPTPNIDHKYIPISQWPTIDGFACSYCGDQARQNPGDNREWGCARCDGSSHSLALNFHPFTPIGEVKEVKHDK